MRGLTWTLLALLPLAAACGGESEREPKSAAGSAGSSAGPGGSGGTSGSGGSAGSAGSAGSPVTAPDCSGTFGPRVQQFSVPSPAELASPAIGPGELELFYVHYDSASAPGQFRRSTRASREASFGSGEVVTELDGACMPDEYRTIDLSSDGLRAYLMCFSTLDFYATYGQLRIAHRESLAAPFVLDAMTYGQVGASPSISLDELSVYTSYEQGIGSGPLQRYSRDSADSSFEPGTDVAGLAAAAYLSSPDIGPDDRAIFASQDGGLVRAQRADAMSQFETPEILLPREPLENGLFVTFGAPEASADCRTLYAVAVDDNGTGISGNGTYSIVQLRR